VSITHTYIHYVPHYVTKAKVKLPRTTPWRLRDSLILGLGISWRWVVSFKSRPIQPRGKSPRTQSIGGWVGSTTGLDDVERSEILPQPGVELRPPSQ
jgi:hypothetical protein